MAVKKTPNKPKASVSGQKPRTIAGELSRRRMVAKIKNPRSGRRIGGQ